MHTRVALPGWMLAGASERLRHYVLGGREGMPLLLAKELPSRRDSLVLTVSIGAALPKQLQRSPPYLEKCVHRLTKPSRVLNACGKPRRDQDLIHWQAAPLPTA